MDTKEIYEQRRLTMELIRSKPTVITLLRAPDRVKLPSGEYGPVEEEEIETPRARYFSPILDEHFVSQMAEGVRSTHILIGPYFDDIRDGDEFEVDGRQFKVNFVYPDKTYQVKAEVVAYASPS